MVSGNDETGQYPARAEDFFPRERTTVVRLRSSSALFAEICEDYETLARDLNALGCRTDCSEPGTRAVRDQLLDSLQGVTEEIRTALTRSGGGETDQRHRF